MGLSGSRRLPGRSQALAGFLGLSKALEGCLGTPGRSKALQGFLGLSNAP